MLDIKKLLFFILLSGLFFFNLYFASSNVLKIREDYQHALKELETSLDRKLATLAQNEEKTGSKLTETEQSIQSLLQMIRTHGAELKTLGSDLSGVKDKVELNDALRDLLQRAIDLQEDPFSKVVKQLEASSDDFEEGVELPLQKWYENWRAMGLNIAEPDEPSVTIYIASDKDIVSRFIRDYGSWVCCSFIHSTSSSSFFISSFSFSFILHLLRLLHHQLLFHDDDSFEFCCQSTFFSFLLLLTTLTR